MTIDVKELLGKIEEQAFRCRHAESNGIRVDHERERLKNVLFNNVNDVIEALKIALSADTQIRMLEASVESADAELKELDDEIKRLRSAAASKAAARGKGKTKAETGINVE